MAERTYPYSQFNFLVEWNGLDPNDTVKAGFQEVSGTGLEVNVWCGRKVRKTPARENWWSGTAKLQRCQLLPQCQIFKSQLMPPANARSKRSDDYIEPLAQKTTPA